MRLCQAMLGRGHMLSVWGTLAWRQRDGDGDVRIGLEASLEQHYF